MRAAKIGDGRPSYWAAPMTTIASAGRWSSTWPCAQMRYVAYEPTRTTPTNPRSTRRPRSRTTDRRLTMSPSDACRAMSATVALLVLRARPAPARVVAPDPRSARSEAGLGAARVRAGAAVDDRLVAERFAHGSC